MAAPTVSKAIIGAKSVRCGHCRARLGDLVDPLPSEVVPVAERGGPFTEFVRVERKLLHSARTEWSVDVRQSLAQTPPARR
jgi:hypothetical protein